MSQVDEVSGPSFSEGLNNGNVNRATSEILASSNIGSSPGKQAKTESEMVDSLGGEFATDHFRIYEFKIKRCPRSKPHDWTACPFAHPGEKAKRRDPMKFHYSTRSCPNHKKTGTCPRGQTCPLAHGVFECWLHPSRYRTHMCSDGTDCRRRICFFAHRPEELREPPPEDPELTKKVTMILGDKGIEDDDFALAEQLGYTSPLLGGASGGLGQPPILPPLSPSPVANPPSSGTQTMALQNQLLKQQLQVLQQLLRLQVTPNGQPGGSGANASNGAARMPNGGPSSIGDISDQIGRLEAMQAQKLQEILQLQGQIESLQGLAAKFEEHAVMDQAGVNAAAMVGLQPGLNPLLPSNSLVMQQLAQLQRNSTPTGSEVLLGGGDLLPSAALYHDSYASNLAAAQAQAQAQAHAAQEQQVALMRLIAQQNFAQNSARPSNGSMVSGGPTDFGGFMPGPPALLPQEPKTSWNPQRSYVGDQVPQHAQHAQRSSLLHSYTSQGGNGNGNGNGSGAPSLHGSQLAGPQQQQGGDGGQGSSLAATPTFNVGSTVPRRPVAIPVLPSQPPGGSLAQHMQGGR